MGERGYDVSDLSSSLETLKRGVKLIVKAILNILAEAKIEEPGQLLINEAREKRQTHRNTLELQAPSFRLLAHPRDMAGILGHL